MKVIFLDVDGCLNCNSTKAVTPSGCVGVADKYIKRLKKIIDLKLNDYIVNFLMRCINENWSLSSQSLVFPGFYEPLKEIIDSFDDLSNDTISRKILSYLNDFWYSSNSEEAWYDSHKSKDNLYYGYWCYEIGAVVKALGMNEIEVYFDLLYGIYNKDIQYCIKILDKMKAFFRLDEGKKINTFQIDAYVSKISGKELNKIHEK